MLVGLGVVLGDQDDLSVVFVAPPVGLTLVEDLVVVHLLNEQRIVVESSSHSVQIVVYRVTHSCRDHHKYSH